MFFTNYMFYCEHKYDQVQYFTHQVHIFKTSYQASPPYYIYSSEYTCGTNGWISVHVYPWVSVLDSMYTQFEKTKHKIHIYEKYCIPCKYYHAWYYSESYLARYQNQILYERGTVLELKVGYELGIA